MQIRNTTQAYGWVSILLHWLMAVALIGMYVIGTYMVDLEYYDSLYHTLPALHKAIGVMLAGLLLVRLAWLMPNPTHCRQQQRPHLHPSGRQAGACSACTAC